MAFSNPGYSEMLQAAIDYAWEEGAVLVAATGNDGSSAVTFPAGDRGVIGVSNTDQNDALNGSSNYGQDVFLGAPGTGIATTSRRRRLHDDQRDVGCGCRGRGRSGADQRRVGRLERRDRVAGWRRTPRPPGRRSRPATVA